MKDAQVVVPQSSPLANWQKWKLSHAFKLIGSGTTPTTSVTSYFQGDIPWLNTGDLNDGFIASTSKFVSEQALKDFSALKLYPENSLIIALYGATIGKLGILRFDACVNQACCVLAEPKALDTKFTFYWLISERKNIIELARGGGQPNISQEIVKQLRVLAPSFEEQTAIATFLDRKTAAIDILIAKKQRLIELLEEKRAALINQAVTKGLSPNVTMKDSGIPWIGEIPEHWEITKLKWLSPFITVGIVITPSKYYVDEGIPCLRSLNIKPGEILSKNLVYISEESNNLLAKSKIFKGDLVCVRTGQPGTTAVVDERFENANCIDLILIRKTKKASSEFLCLQMNSEVCRSQYTVGTSGAIQQHFNVETAQNLILCDPPLDEQAEIVTHCRRIIAKHNLLIQKAFVQIKKLQEYRQSLITAAVTGKLEVPIDEAA